jgi:hypothetical protein
VSLSLEGLTDIVDGEVLLPQSNNLVTDGITFWSVVRSFARLDEEGSLRVLAELVAEHAETPGGIAKALGDLLRGETLNKVSPECLVLPMGGVGRFEEDALQLCKRFSCTGKHRATLLSVQRRFSQEGTHALYDVCLISLAVFFYDRTLAKHTCRRQVSIGIYQFKDMITESKQKTHRNKVESGVGVRFLWNGGNPG